jgi:glycosyltransferase involved in cell wall biosynthesis
MKILFVIGSLNVGGAETQLVMLIQGLVKKGVGCQVFAMRKEGPLLSKLEDIGVNVFDGGYLTGPGGFWHIKQTLKCFNRLFRIIHTGSYDVVHAYLPMANFLASIAAKLCFTPKIITSRRALGSHQDRSGIWRYMDKVSNYLSDRVTVNSQGVWRDVVERDDINENKLVLIYNGIDSSIYDIDNSLRSKMRKSLAVGDDDIVIGMVANLIPYKGHKDALVALQIIVKSYPNSKMIFVGQDRGIQSELEAMASEFGIDERVVFLGKRDDVPMFLSACDIALVASHEEGFCNALLEAMASGLPTVATDVGGNAEALSYGELGKLVPARDPEKMAEALLLLSNSGQHKNIGKLARDAVVKRYSINTLVDSHLRLYANN